LPPALSAPRTFGDIAGLALIAIATLALAWLGEVQRPPAASPYGIGLVVLAGGGLGVFAWLRRPSWPLRAAAAAGLATLSIALNLLWFAEINRTNENHFFQRQPDSLLARYHRHSHMIARRKSAYLLMADYLEGKPVRWVGGGRLAPWRLFALSQVSEIAEIPPPGRRLPTAQELADAYENRVLEFHPRRWYGEEHPYRIVGITQAAATADYFVVLEVQGVDFVIPNTVWETFPQRREPRAR
jgi:hypothetical protein